MRNFFAVMAISVAVLSSPAYSASQDERIKACLEGELSTDEGEQLAIDISELAFVFSDYVANNAAACFTKLTGQPSEFERGRGLVVEAEAIEILRQNKIKLENAAKVAAEEQEKFERELSEKAKKAPIIRRELKCNLLERRGAIVSEQAPYKEVLSSFDASIEARKQEAILQTVLECNAWASEDRRSAMTNPVCQKIFFEMGLPDSKVEGPSLADVATARSQVSSRDIELIVLDQRLHLIDNEEFYVSINSEVQLIKRKRELEKQSKETIEQPPKSDCDVAWGEWKKNN